MFICHFVIYPTVVRHLLIMVTCEKLGSDSETADPILLAIPDITCFEGEHMTWALASLAGLFVWGLGIPLALYFFLKANKEKMAINVRIRALTGFVADGYESDFFYWEAVVQLRRFAMLFIAVLPVDRSGELALYQLVSIGSIVLHLNAKPFDNRAGELLDKIELYGLLNFFLLVSVMQVIFLVDMSSRMDMLPAFVTGLLVFFAAFFVKRNFLGHSWIFKAVGLCYFAGVLVVYSLGSEGELRQLAIFLFFMLAATLNLYYVLWVALRALQQIRKSAADAFIASRTAAKEMPAEESPTGGSPTRAGGRRSSGGSSPGGRGGRSPKGRGSVLRGSTSMLDQALDRNAGAETTGFLSKIQAFLAKSEGKSQGALIRYEPGTNELILGLHPDTYMNDPHLSAYARRTLARSGPFLTDQEREYVSMALKDCLQHVIVSLASERVNVGLLEFLCRLAFAWKFRKQELGKEKEEGVGENSTALTNKVNFGGSQTIMVAPNPAPKVHDEEPGTGSITAVGGLVAKMAGAKWRRKAQNNLTRMMFDQATFENGMTAADFQSELQQVMNMSKRKFDEIFKDFMTVKEEITAEAH